MGKGGRPKKPKHLKVVEGTYRKDRDGSKKSNPDGLENLEKVPYAQAYMSDRAQKHWREHAKVLQQMGRLTPVDVPMLRAYCIEMARYEDAIEAMDENLPIQVFRSDSGKVKHAQVSPLMTVAKQSLNQARRLASKLGLTIVDREQTVSSERKTMNPYEANRRKNF